MRLLTQLICDIKCSGLIQKVQSILTVSSGFCVSSYHRGSVCLSATYLVAVVVASSG